MDLYEAWQRKRFRKFKTGSDPFRAAGALKDEPRITQEDVVVEDNMFRAHELHPVGSPEYKKAGRRSPDSAFQIEAPAANSPANDKPALTARKSDSSPGFASLRAFANGLANGGLQPQAGPVDLKSKASNLAKQRSSESGKAGKGETEPNQTGGKQGWRVYQNPALDVETDSLGGTRHILRDFQEQLQGLRAQIALLSAENGDLKQKLAGAELDLKAAAAAHATLSEDLSNQQDVLRATQGDLKLTRNRELRLQRLQESLKQLMEEKDAKLSNDSINSRAVIERTNNLKARIQDLEKQLHAHKANGLQESTLAPANCYHPLENGVEDALPNGQPEVHQPRAASLQLKQDLAQRSEQASKVADEVKKLEDALASSQADLSAASSQLDEKSIALEAARADIELLQIQQADEQEARAALEVLHQEHTQTLAELAAAKGSCREACEAQSAAAADLERLQHDHKQVVLELRVLQGEQEQAISQRDAAQQDFTAQLGSLQKQHRDLEKRHGDLLAEHKGLVQQHAAALNAHSNSSSASKQQLVELQRRFEEQAAQHEAFKERHAEALSAHQETVSGLDQELCTLKKRHGDLVDQHQAAVCSHDSRTAALEVELTELRRQHAAALNVTEELAEKLDREGAACRTAAAKILAAAEKEAELLARALAAEEAAQNMAAEVEKAISERELAGVQLKEAKAAHESSTEDYKTRESAHTQQIETLQQEVRELDTVCKDVKARASKMEAQVSTTAAELANASELMSQERQVSKKALADAHSARAAASEAEEKLAAVEQQLSETNQKLVLALSSVDEEQAVTRGVLEEAQSRGLLVDQLRRELAAAHAEIDHYEHQNENGAEEAERLAASHKAALKAKEQECSSANQKLQAVAVELAAMRQSLDSAKEEAAAKLKELEDLHRQLEAANSDALAAKEAAAGLNIDLANALDRLASQTAIAASAKEAAEARETALKEELKGLKSRHAEQVCLIEAKLGEAGERSQALAAHVEELKESVKHAAQQQKEHTAAAEGKLAAVQTELGAQLGAEKEKVMKLEDATASSKRAAADAERELRELTARAAHKEAELQQLIAEQTVELEKSKAEASQRSSMHARTVSDLKAALTAAQLSSESSNQAAKKHFEELAETAAALKQVKAGAEQSIAEGRELKAEKEELATRIAVSEQEVLAKEAAVLELKDGAEALKKQLAESQTQQESAELALEEAEKGAAAEAKTLRARVASQQQTSSALQATITKLEGELAEAAADKAVLWKQREDVTKEASASKEASEQLRATLDATHKTHHRTVSDMQDVMNKMREAPEQENAALSFELWRLVEENDMLRGRVLKFEADMKQLVDTSETLGHSNPKQKIQYHLRWKQELEELRNECTALLRERFQMEQCIRYLAVRCGLSIAVERDVTASKDRTPLDKLQPASLVPHYRFSARNAHLTDVAGDHIKLEDLTEEVPEPESPAASERESVSTALSSRPDQAVEQQILARVAFVCNPPQSKASDGLQKSPLTSALLASDGRNRDPVREWNPTTRILAPSRSSNAAKPEALRSREALPYAAADSVSDTGSAQEDGRRHSNSEESHRQKSIGPAKASSLPSRTGIPKPNFDAARPSQAVAADRLSSRISAAFSGRQTK